MKKGLSNIGNKIEIMDDKIMEMSNAESKTIPAAESSFDILYTIKFNMNAINDTIKAYKMFEFIITSN